MAAGRARDPLEIQGARLAPDVRDGIDAEIEALLAEAVAFALASAQPGTRPARSTTCTPTGCAPHRVGEMVV